MRFPVQESWKNDLPPALRARIAELHHLSVWTWLKIPFMFGIWGATALVAVHNESLWIRIPCWILIGFTLHGLGVFMHEGAHGSLFRRSRLDRVVGFLCGLPIFFSCTCYRATHLLHHQHENTAKDPDNLYATVPVPLLRWLIYFGWFAFGMPIYILIITVSGPFRASGIREKVACVAETLAIIAFDGTLFYLASRFGFLPVLVNGWLFGILFAMVIANFRGLAEHTQLRHKQPPDPFRSTRTTPSNALISFFFNNQNYHLEHHLFTGVPWNNLPRVHQLMEPIYRKREASISRGYLAWVVDALRYGPNRTLHYTADRQPVLDSPRSVTSGFDIGRS